MAIRLPSHLHRARSGILHFRITIPPDLRHHFNTREIHRSLRTASVSQAAPVAQTLAQTARRVFQQLRTRTMSNQKKTLTDPFDVSEFGLITELSFDEFMRPKLKLIPEPGDTPEDRVQAQVDFLRAVGVAGGQAGTGVPALNQALLTVPKSAAGIVGATVPTLSSYVELYLANAFVAAKPTEKTLDSYRAAIGLFIDIVGDKPLHVLGVADQNRFEDMIGKIPANRTKIASAGALSIDELTVLDIQKLSPQSTKNIAQRTNNFLNWAFRREGGKAPFELMGNVRITVRSKTVNRRAFMDDELRILFNAATYAQGRQQSPYMYWLPLIGLHTGMRINEIAQLALADIGWKDGIACFHVTDDDADNAKDRRAKRVKTDAGRRIVPVHDALVSLGLLDYAQIVRQDGHKVLFPELIGGRDGPGQPASKHFARYCDRVGLRDPALVFHSFRHGAVGRMRTAGIAKELRMVVVGHSPADDTHDGYGDIKNDFSIADRKRAVDALNFDQVLDYITLSELRPEKSDLNAALVRAQSR
jgi:integrase